MKSSSNQSNPAESFKHAFVHSVFFWLKPDLTAEQTSEFELALHTMVQDSQYAHTGHIGKPAGTPREVVDNSYDYSLIVTFDSASDHDAYQTEAPHDLFRETIKPFTQRVQIYDSVG